MSSEWNRGHGPTTTNSEGLEVEGTMSSAEINAEADYLSIPTTLPLQKNTTSTQIVTNPLKVWANVWQGRGIGWNQPPSQNGETIWRHLSYRFLHNSTIFATQATTIALVLDYYEISWCRIGHTKITKTRILSREPRIHVIIMASHYPLTICSFRVEWHLLTDHMQIWQKPNCEGRLICPEGRVTSSKNCNRIWFNHKTWMVVLVLFVNIALKCVIEASYVACNCYYDAIIVWVVIRNVSRRK